MKKYVMSEKEEDLQIDLEEITEFLSTEKLVGRNEMKYPLGFSSPLFNVPTISLFDDSLLMEKYPNGVVTENFVLIPFDKFKEIKEKATTKLDRKTYDKKNMFKIDPNTFKPFLNEFMLAFVEMSLNIEITPEDKLQIKKDLNILITEEEERLIKAGFETKDYKSHLINVNIPTKLTNRELLKVIEGKDYAFESKVKNAVDFSQEVKEILKLNEIYLENISSIKDKIEEVNIKQIDSNISLDEFKELVEKSLSHLVSPVLPLKIVNEKINEVLQLTEPSIENFIEMSKEKVFPYLSKLPPLQFKSSMELIFKEAFGAMDDYSTRFENAHNNDIKSQFALALVPDLDSLNRHFLITMITGFDAISKSFTKVEDSERKFSYKMN